MRWLLIIGLLIFVGSGCNDSMTPSRRLSAGHGDVSLSLSPLITPWKTQQGGIAKRVQELRIRNDRPTDFTYQQILVDVTCDNPQAQYGNVTAFSGGSVVSNVNLSNLTGAQRIRINMNISATVPSGEDDFIDIALDTNNLKNGATGQVHVSVCIFAIIEQNGKMIRTDGQTVTLIF